MTVLERTVLLLKAQISEDGSDKYELLLKENGLVVQQVKTLDFIFKNLENLREKLKKPSDYSGLIFSSPRCVHAVCQALNGDVLDDEWKSKPNFVVGEATYKDVAEKLGIDCSGKETGNSNNLAKFIIEGKEQYDCQKPFLFPHGNLKTGTLKTELQKDNLFMEDVLVYDTIPNPTLETEMRGVTNNFTSIPEYVVFFSPSGVRSAVPYLKNIPMDLNDVKFIAIGPVTENAMKEEKLTVYSSAKNPTPEDVLKALNN